VPEDQSKERTVRIFISYSWDSEEHKEWALEFAKRLRSDGLDAIIDALDLRLGARAPKFMEASVRDSDRVLVICTPEYKRRFDLRKGGAGYEGHIITGEIVSEVGKNKFIPILRGGAWKDSVPTALSGIHGVDLRLDSLAEYRKLLEELYDVTETVPVGERPTWLTRDKPASHTGSVLSETQERKFLDQRMKARPQTDIQTEILSKPRWQIWIRPTTFLPARFQSVEQCREFMLAAYVRVEGWFPFPFINAKFLEMGPDWVAGENDHSEFGRIRHLESWTLYRSGQFVDNRALDEVPQLRGRLHVLEILDTTTAAVEFAARMAGQEILLPEAVISFQLSGIDGLSLTWPKDQFGDLDEVVARWSEAESVTIRRHLTLDVLRSQRRELAFDVSVEIYKHFGWTEIPIERLKEKQAARFGAAR
jgi:hypothetical protein